MKPERRAGGNPVAKAVTRVPRDEDDRGPALRKRSEQFGHVESIFFAEVPRRSLILEQPRRGGQEGRAVVDNETGDRHVAGLQQTRPVAAHEARTTAS
jgi:hypothetical protein